MSATLISVSVTLILEEAEIWETDTEMKVTGTLLLKYLGNVTHILGVTHILDDTHWAVLPLLLCLFLQ